MKTIVSYRHDLEVGKPYIMVEEGILAKEFVREVRLEPDNGDGYPDLANPLKSIYHGLSFKDHAYRWVLGLYVLEAVGEVMWDGTALVELGEDLKKDELPPRRLFFSWEKKS